MCKQGPAKILLKEQSQKSQAVLREGGPEGVVGCMTCGSEPKITERIDKQVLTAVRRGGDERTTKKRQL